MSKLVFCAALVFIFCFATFSQAPVQDQIKLPPGFKIEVFQSNVPEARPMALSPSGTLFVGTREAGKVYAIKNKKVFVIAHDLNMPNGVAFRDGSLYVAEISRVIRYD